MRNRAFHLLTLSRKNSGYRLYSCGFLQHPERYHAMPHRFVSSEKAQFSRISCDYFGNYCDFAADSLRLRGREAHDDESGVRRKRNKFCEGLFLPENITGPTLDFLSAFLGNYPEALICHGDQQERWLWNGVRRNFGSILHPEVIDRKLTGAQERLGTSCVKRPSATSSCPPR